MLSVMCITLLWGALVLVRSEGGPGRSKDERILLAFRDSIENWDDVYSSRGMTGWGPCTVGTCYDLCNWSGIECDPLASEAGDRVTSLELSCDNNCSIPAVGRLLPELADLTELRTLDLSGNQFYGGLEPHLGDNGTFPELVALNLQGNNLTGPLIENWAVNSAFLKVLTINLADNELTGTFPASWATTNTSMVSLLSWNIAYNQLTGPLPPYINGMITMEFVGFQGNQFTGTLPPDWGRQGFFFNNTYNATQALHDLLLHGNDLSGELPPEWAASGSFLELKTLTLGNNTRLGSTLPAAWGAPGALPTLNFLYLSNTNLSGPLPAEWGSGGLPSLHQLAMYGNNLTGTIPSSWAGLPALEHIYVQPGNPQLCTQAPQGAAFQLCMDDDKLCTQPLQPSSNPACSASQQGSSSGSGTPVGAIVGAIVAAVAVAAAALLCLAARGRRWLPGLCSKWQTDQEQAKSPSSLMLKALEEGSTKQYKSVETSQNGDHTAPNMLTPDSAFIPADCLQCVPEKEVDASAEGCRSASSTHALSAQAEQQQHSGGSRQAQHSGGSQQAQQTGGSQQAQRPATQPSIAASHRSSSSAGAPVREGGGPSLGAGSLMGLASVAMGSRHHSRSMTNEELESYLSSGWEIPPEEIQILHKPDGTPCQLGSGGFGKVYKALRNGVQVVAVKVLRSGEELLNENSQSEFQREIAILRACRDSNIVQPQGVCTREPEGTMLVMEYMEGGSLLSNIRQEKVTWYHRGKRIAVDVALGLSFLHKRRIVHLDCKSANVLLTREGKAKIADVGMSKILMRDRDYVSGATGTLAWSAPEMLWGQRCTTKAEMPIRGQMRDVCCPEECPEEVRDIILACLQPDPAQRPSAVELVDLLRKAPARPPGRAGSGDSATTMATKNGADQQQQPAAAADGGSGGEPHAPASTPLPLPRLQTMARLSSVQLQPLGEAEGGLSPFIKMRQLEAQQQEQQQQGQQEQVQEQEQEREELSQQAAATPFSTAAPSPGQPQCSFRLRSQHRLPNGLLPGQEELSRQLPPRLQPTPSMPAAAKNG